MVTRNKDLDNPPPDLLLAKWDDKKADVLVSRDLHHHSTSCYRDTTIEALKVLYKNKCAFCEREYGDELEVDHYRPKKTRQVAKEPKFDTTGYYWLSYEWSNLILCCSKCNVKKSNKFPLIGWNNVNRISSHIVNPAIVDYDAYDFSWIQGYETPLLLNPESDLGFEKHLRYLPNGSIKGITNKGIATIEICDLDRGWLVIQRKKILDEYSEDISNAINDYIKLKDIGEFKGALKVTFRRIQKHTEDDYPFSLLHNYISCYFKFFIGARLEISVRNRICEYWDDFKNGIV